MAFEIGFGPSGGALLAQKRAQREDKKERSAAKALREELTEPLVGASQSADPVEFMRSFAGAAGLPALQERLTGGLASDDPLERQAAGQLQQGLQAITPEGQQQAFDAQVQAEFQQQIDNEMASLQADKLAAEVTRSNNLGGFTNFAERSTAIRNVAGLQDGFIAANDISQLMRDDGSGNFVIPSDVRGRLKIKRLPILLALKEMIGTGVLQPAELGWLEGIVQDPTRWGSLKTLDAEQKGELDAFMDLMERQHGIAAGIYGTSLGDEMPGLFQLPPRGGGGQTELPTGFVPQ